MVEKRRISWEEYHEAIDRLAIKIADSNFKVSHVISIAKGGLRVGDQLCRLFRCKSSYLGVESYESTTEGEVADKQKEDVIFGRDISSTTKNEENALKSCTTQMWHTTYIFMIERFYLSFYLRSITIHFLSNMSMCFNKTL